MEFNEALAKILELIDDISPYEAEIDTIRNGNIATNPIESEEYKNLSDDYEKLKAQYKAKFIQSLTEDVVEPEDNDEPDDAPDEIRFEDLDLSGEND